MQVIPTVSRLTQLTDALDGFDRLLFPQPVDDPLPVKRVASCQSNETWSATNCTVAADTADYVYGLQSQKMTVNAGATGTATCVLPVTYDVCGNVGVQLKVDDLSKVSTIAVYIDEDDTPNGYKCTFYGGASSPYNRWLLASGEWTTAWADRDRMSAVGSPSTWGMETGGSVDDLPIVRVRLEVVAQAGESPVVRIGSVLSQKFPAAAILLHFDDGHPSQLTNALPRLTARGWRAGLGLVGAWVGETMPAYSETGMTAAEIDQWYDAGFDVHNHSWDHTAFTSSTPVATLIEQFEKNRQFAESNGWVRGSGYILSPSLYIDCVTRNAATVLGSLGYKGSRGQVIRDANDSWPTMGERSFPWMPTDLMNLPYVSLNDSTLSTAKTVATRTVHRRQVMMVFIHDVRETPTGWGITIANFEDFLGHLQPYVDAGQLRVATFDEIQDATWARLYPYQSKSLR